MAVMGESATRGVLEGLKKLEYRGYDSAGIAVKEGNHIQVFKAIGDIGNLEKTGVAQKVDGSIAIGHTRWATHGGVTVDNSHPHASADKKFWVVHNGIIENFEYLKSKYLISIPFSSETDSEVIPQLLQYFYQGDVLNALMKTMNELRGSYAIVVMSLYDNKLYFARKSSPLLVSKGCCKWSLASDIKGFDSKNEICVIPDNSYGVIDNNIVLYDINGNSLNIVWEDYSHLSLGVDKGEYEHFMLKEIYEIPRALRLTYESFLSSRLLMPQKINSVLIVGCGTSYHSGLLGKYYIEKIAKIRCECVIASEFVYSDCLIEDGTLAIFISQSGETADTLLALRKAKGLGLYTLAITNVVGSSITHEGDSVLYIDAGAEICVASTKAYTSQSLMLMLVSNLLANIVCGDVKNVEREMLMCNCSCLKDYLFISDVEFENVFSVDINQIDVVASVVAKNICNVKDLHLIGKNVDYITAMEGALKIKEVSYIVTDAYPCGELKHGTLSLICDDSYVICVATKEGVLLEKTKNAISEIVARGGKVIVISQYNEGVFGGAVWKCGSMQCDKVCQVIELPRLPELLLPIISIIPIDIIAYRVACSRGNNPDKPRNLAKSVTVE